MKPWRTLWLAYALLATALIVYTGIAYTIYKLTTL